jgi:peptide/nickel transport system substrate-binding protein
MRVDLKPWSDERVRQAMRLIVDRPQMIEQALLGEGRVANDMYSPYDPAYAAHLPQREQDLEQAKSLLSQAGQAGLSVELVTSSFLAGSSEAAQVFAEQAKGAGANIKVKKLDGSTFFGDQYLKWPFAQDFWYTRSYLSQVATSTMKGALFNEQHWADPEFEALIKKARATVDVDARKPILHQAQEIEYERGGYIVWSFRNQIDAYDPKWSGFVPDRRGAALSSYAFRQVSQV